MLSDEAELCCLFAANWKFLFQINRWHDIWPPWEQLAALREFDVDCTVCADVYVCVFHLPSEEPILGIVVVQ